MCCFLPKTLRGVMATLLVACPLSVAQVSSTCVLGDSPGDQLGSSVARAGDVDNDGVIDFVAGAPYDDNMGSSSGMVRVYSGLVGAVLFSFNGDTLGDRLGWAVAGAGDVNNDGFDDIVVGAPNDDNNGITSGMARVYSGKTGAILFSFDGDQGGDSLGYAVAGAGDVDGDGFDDLIGGAYTADTGNGVDSGFLRVYSGKTGAILRTLPGDGAHDLMGCSVAAAGDVDGDSIPDILGGAAQDDNNGVDSGCARAFSGATGQVLVSVDGDSAVCHLGWAVSSAGDIDGDGRADFVVGSPDFGFASSSDEGRTKVISGASGALLFRFDGEEPGERLGAGVAGGGDWNGDGIPDILVGAPNAGEPAADAGRVSVFSGAGGAELFRAYGGSGDERLGSAVSAAGDIDGDGLDDLVAGAPGALGSRGSVLVFSGCSGRVLHYGAGCPGSGGYTPRLGLAGCPLPGSTIVLAVDDALGGARALLLFGLGQAKLPMAGSCFLLAAPLTPLVVALPLSGSGAGSGLIAVPGTLPTTVAPVSVTMQVFVEDRGVPQGFCSSNGLLMGIP